MEFVLKGRILSDWVDGLLCYWVIGYWGDLGDWGGQVIELIKLIKEMGYWLL